MNPIRKILVPRGWLGSKGYRVWGYKCPACNKVGTPYYSSSRKLAKDYYHWHKKACEGPGGH